ncbi:MAG: histidinol-phosphatase [Chitinophagaceae bacterium]
MKKILFIDRDGTVIIEPPPDGWVDSWSKLEFYPHVFRYLSQIAEFDYELVMVSNQDGLGTAAFPESKFWPIQNFIMQCFKDEGINFNDCFFDKSSPADHAPTRKPNTGMLISYLNNAEYDIKNSLVIGDRITDVQLAKNLGCKAIWLNNGSHSGYKEITDSIQELKKSVALETQNWKDIYEFFASKNLH